MSAEMLLIVVIIMFFCIGLAGDVMDRRDKKRTYDWRVEFIAKNMERNGWLIRSYEHDGFLILWKWHPERCDISEIRKMTKFLEESSLVMKKSEIDEIKKREVRPDVLALIDSWKMED